MSSNAQLGALPSGTDTTSPVRLNLTGVSVASLEGGFAHSMALDTSGAAWWFGELGPASSACAAAQHVQQPSMCSM